MASANAQKCLNCFSSEPGDQHRLTWAVLSLWAAYGSDGSEPFVVDDVAKGLESVFPPTHSVMQIVRADLQEIRERVGTT